MRPALLHPPLVGRERQLDRLRQLWAAAEAGAPGVALLTGEAGSGKTRLVQELIGEVSRLDSVVLEGECLLLGGQDLPYGPFLGLLDDMLASSAPDGSLSDDLSALLTAVESAPLLRVPDGAEQQGGRTDRGRLFQRFLMVVTRLADISPVLLVLEDVHWADRSSLDLLAFLVAGLRRKRVLLVVTARDDEPDDQPLAQLLMELRRRGSAVRLPPLEDAAIDALLAAGPHLPVAVRREVARRADGNPFYALELGLAWKNGARTLPDELADAVTARLRGLSGNVEQVVRTTAAVGRRFTDELLDSVLDLAEEERISALQELVERGALLTDGDHYRFRHALLHEAVYTRMVPAERRRVHRAVAPALQRIADERGLDLETAIALSFHWQAADEPDMALAAAVRAEALARQAHAHEEAALQAERAIGLWDTASKRPAGVQLTGLLVQAAEDRRWAGDIPQALVHARRAAALAEASGQAFAEQATALEKLGQLLWADGDVARALECHEQAVALARREGMTTVTARTLAAWGTRLMTAGQFRRAVDVAQEAAEAARQLGLPDVEAHALNTSGTSRAVGGDLQPGLQQLRTARDLARKLTNAEELLRAHTNHTFVLLEAGFPGEAGDLAAEGVAELTALDVPHAILAALITNLAVARWRAGRWSEAQRVAEASLADRTRLDRQYLQCLLVELHLARGNRDAAASLLEELLAESSAVTDSTVMIVLGSLKVEQALQDDRTEDALRLASEAVRGLDDRRLNTITLRLCAVCTRALARSQAGRVHGDARALGAEVSTAVTDVLGTYRASPGASSLRAQALMTQCDAELAGYGGLESDTQWATAADVWRSAGQPYDVAYALFRQAEALTAVRRRKEAAERLDQAESLLVNLGAMPLLQRVRRLRAAGALGEAPVDQRPDAMAGRDRLGELGVTGRERQVLELLAQGKTNRQIGRALGTTERTAGTHVSNLLRKLGVSSRTEAVFVAHRLR